MSQTTAIKTLDVLINGHSYPINCPAEAEDSLQQSAKVINQFIQGIRKQAPNMTQENLLVLCALTLQEKAQQLEEKLAQEAQAKTLVESMLADTKALLPNT